MTNAPENRKTHVIRILGTNAAGDVIPEIWVDVERMDAAKSVSSDDNYQGIERKFRWCDDPQGDEYEPDGNPSRKTKIVKVCDPSGDDLDNPDEWVPIEVITHMKSVTSQNNYQGQVESLINTELVESRVVEKRRILHYDTNIDNDAQAAFDADSSLKVYVVPGNQYTRDESTKDDSQYVEHEIITYLKQSGNNVKGANAVNKMGESGDQGRQTKLLNQYLIDDSEDAKLNELGDGGINPPYRLDPYQNIVNVKFGYNVIVVFADAGGAVAPGFRTPSVYTPDPDNSSIKLLKTFDVPYQSSGFQPGYKCYAYRVPVNAGEFMTTVWAGITGLLSVSIGAFVFAIDGDEDAALAQAVDGTKLIIPFQYLESHSSSDLPASISPPGLLWCVTATVKPGLEVNWKIKLQNHRSDQNPTPPNKMVQVYPLGPAFSFPISSSFTQVVSGYSIDSYRLDKKGTGTVYGKATIATDPTPHIIAPQWNVTVSNNGGSKGIPFQDPPPLIGRDI